MPVGVPRIVYCMGEELPTNWTDLYNFIFRRRMIFLLQYLDDELCNQICGLLINIHYSDRNNTDKSQDVRRDKIDEPIPETVPLEPFEMNMNARIENKQNKSEKSVDQLLDLLNSDMDLEIHEAEVVNRYILQKICLKWLVWNAQFVNFNDEPYLDSLIEALSWEFKKDSGDSPAFALDGGFHPNNAGNISRFLQMFQNMRGLTNSSKVVLNGSLDTNNNHLDLYEVFRYFANFGPQMNSVESFQTMQKWANPSQRQGDFGWNLPRLQTSAKTNEDWFSTFAEELGHNVQKDFYTKMTTQEAQGELSEKTLSQRRLRRAYKDEKRLNHFGTRRSIKSAQMNPLAKETFSKINLLKSGGGLEDLKNSSQIDDYDAFYFEKVFMLINSFGGAVGAGVAVHDALQFIKAGSLTLGLGVAASASSLVLAGGSIGNRLVTEACHVMIHQPEGGIQGQASDVWLDSQEILQIRRDVADIYSTATYRSRHKTLRDLDRDFYLTASETIKYGLADEIATNKVMAEIFNMIREVWDVEETKQERLLDEALDREETALRGKQNTSPDVSPEAA